MSSLGPVPELTVALRPIGRVRTPYGSIAECPKNPREATGEARVELEPAYLAGLTSLETCSHLWLLTWLDRAPRDKLVIVPPIDDREHGVFATRTPVRPNPIGLHAVQLHRIEGSVLHVSGVDVLDGTLLLDIKPYFPSIDTYLDAVVGWHARRAHPSEERA